MKNMMQKIVPFLWFDGKAEEAMNFYVSIFENAEILDASRLLEGPGKGSVIGSFMIEGVKFGAMDGGPYFDFTPAVSISVNFESEEKLTTLWNKLVEGGTVMMPFEEYPFSKKYGWLNDKFGVSWQLNLRGMSNPLAPTLMFVGEKYGRCEEAINFYTSIFKDSKIDDIYRYGDENPAEKGKISHAEFHLNGQQFMALESGMKHEFDFTPAISFIVNCEDQEEVDYFWDALVADGGSIVECGWLTDKFGVSWQVVPTVLNELMADPDPEKVKRVTAAMLKMKKLVIADLEKAAEF